MSRASHVAEPDRCRMSMAAPLVWVVRQ